MSTLPEYLEDALAPETAHREGFRIEDKGGADWAMSKLAKVRAQQIENQAFAQQRWDKIAEWLKAENGKLDHDIEYFEGLLIEWHSQLLDADPKAKTIALPSGQLQARKRPDTVEVDPDVFLPFAKDARPELVRVKPEPNKTAIKEAVLKDGEVLPGVTVQEGTIAYSVKPDLDTLVEAHRGVA